VKTASLILASAGTGKTYRLTGHLLRLLFAGVPPERILATTFTRMAAGEILDRVLERLVEGAADAGKRRELAREVTGGPVSADDCLELLERLVRRIDRFRIRTLDAFFLHLAQLFTLELGLPPEWEIVLEFEDRRLQAEAVARVLRDADRLEWVELLRRLQKEVATRGVHHSLLDVCQTGRSAFLDSSREAWCWIEPPPGLDDAQLERARRVLESLELPCTKKGDPVDHWANAREAILACVTRGTWDALAEIGLVKKVAQGESTFSRHAIPAELSEAIAGLLRHAAHVTLAGLADQNEASYKLLERFERAYRDLKRERRAFRFDDLPVALAPRRAGGEHFLTERELDMWYRLDARIDHLLLDEFQDTAPSQWRILEPLADELLADGTGERSFFCVGDVKQSIYGWRDAEPRLLEEMLPRRYGQLEREELTRSYRSSAVVLDTVDRVFGTIDQNPALSSSSGREELYERRAAAWRAGFRTPEAAKDLPGAVYLLEAREPGDGEGWEELVLRLAAERVAGIVADAPRCTVGVLLRRGKWISRLIYLLRDEGIRASGEGGNPLTDSSAVLHLASLLHLADHPADSAAAFHVATSPLGAALDLAPDVPVGLEAREELARSVRRRLLTEGYGRFCSSLGAAVHAHYSEWDRLRFAQLVDLAHAFEPRASTRPSDFVDLVREEKVEDPSATQVKVMTVHAAKGLEFDAVVLPELDWDVARDATEFLTQRPDPAGPIERVSRRPKREMAQQHAELEALFDFVRGRELGEELCILYVAMTRAIHRLDMLTKYRKPERAPSLTFAGILRAGLAAPGSCGPELWAHPRNTDPWCSDEKRRPADAAEEALEPELRLAPSRRPRALPTETPTAREGGGRIEARALLRPRAARARARGSLIHRWLEEVEWVEDFARSDEELLALGVALEGDLERRRAALADFRGFLAAPSTRAVLSRAGRGEVEVWREREFSVVLPEGERGQVLWNGSFDRVHLEREGGRLARAEVIDFKTDRVRGGAEALERAELYRPQLEAYRRVLARMTGLDANAIETRLLFLASGEDVEVGQKAAPPRAAPRAREWQQLDLGFGGE